jgi:predicted RNA-binding Zn-ribbon protein involved in translation (DUF1610 family)
MSKTYTVSSTDHVEAGLATEAVNPSFPCPKCGKETKDHNTKEDKEAGKQLRICSDRNCKVSDERTVADWSTGQPTLQNSQGQSPLN